jgi:magnesium transporter
VNRGLPMLSIIKNGDKGLEEVDEICANSWLRAVDPSSEQITFLCQHLHVPQDYLLSSLDPDERSHIERDDDVMLIVIRIPHFQGVDADIPYVTIPFGIILTPTMLATVCKINSPIVRGFLSERKKGLTPAKKYRFILYLLLNMAKEYLKAVQSINHQVEELEKRLTRSQRNEEVLELLKYQKSLVYFTTGLRSTELTIDRLDKSGFFHQYPEDGDLHEDVMVEIRQAMEMAEISSNILNQMVDAFASIIANNLNVVMKFLALATIVLALPTLVASIMGMNVTLPMSDHPQAFLMIMALSIVISSATAFYFWRKHWF